MRSCRMPILILLLIAGGFYLYAKADVPVTDKKDATDNSIVNELGLADIAPPSQGGGFDQSHDYAYIQARDKWGIPFALLKAHSIRESRQDPSAYRLEPSGQASFGLMQILWWAGSDRFKKYGASADYIGDGSVLYDPEKNVDIAAQLILDNFNACKGNLRDTINMYNTGKTEAKHPAPGNYVNDVLSYYSKIIGKDV